MAERNATEVYAEQLEGLRRSAAEAWPNGAPLSWISAAESLAPDTLPELRQRAAEKVTRKKALAEKRYRTTRDNSEDPAEYLIPLRHSLAWSLMIYFYNNPGRL